MRAAPPPTRPVTLTEHAFNRFLQRFPPAKGWDFPRALRILRMIALTGDVGHRGHPNRRHARIQWGDGTHSHCIVVLKEQRTRVVILTVMDPTALREKTPCVHPESALS